MASTLRQKCLAQVITRLRSTVLIAGLRLSPGKRNLAKLKALRALDPI